MIDREYIIRLRLPFQEFPGDTDPRAGVRKLRAILKRLLRTYNIRCVECRPADQQPPSKE